MMRYLQNKTFHYISGILICYSLAGFQNIKNNYCPVNLDGKLLKTLDASPHSYFGNIYACNGEVLQVVIWYNNWPYYQLRLENGARLWVSGQFNTGLEVVGAKLRVLGYFEKAPARFKPEKTNPDSYHLLGFAILNTDNRQFVVKPGKESLAQQWLDGKVPVAEKSKK